MYSATDHEQCLKVSRHGTARWRGGDDGVLATHHQYPAELLVVRPRLFDQLHGFRMRNWVKYLLGTLSVLPAIAVVIVATHAFAGDVFAGDPSFAVSIVAPMLLLSVAFLATVTYFVVLVAQSQSMPLAEKIAWAVGLVCAAAIVAPAFWFVNVLSGRLPRCSGYSGTDHE